MSYFLVTGPKFTGLFCRTWENRSRSHVFLILDILTRFGEEIFAIQVGSFVKLTKILHIFGGRAPEFLLTV